MNNPFPNLKLPVVKCNECILEAIRDKKVINHLNGKNVLFNIRHFEEEIYEGTIVKTYDSNKVKIQYFTDKACSTIFSMEDIDIIEVISE